VVSEIRTMRKENQIPQKESLALHVQRGDGYPVSLESALIKLCNLSELNQAEGKVANSFGFVVGTSSYFIPFGTAIDVEAEKAKIQKEMDYIEGFLKSILGKLSNERFVSSAPEQVVAMERKKQSDALAKLEILKSKMSDLS